MKNSIFILIFSILLISCKDQPTKENNSITTDAVSKTETNSNNIDLENINQLLQKSSPYTRDSGDFFGVEALVFDENTVRFSVASLYVGGEIIDREDITGTYKVTNNGNTMTVKFNFNTNFVFVDYLIDGSKKSGKSIKEVSVPYILKGTITKDGYVLLDGWENELQSEKRVKEEKQKLEESSKIEDYGIDEKTLIGKYESVDEEKDITVEVNSIKQEEIGIFFKRGSVSGILKRGGEEKEFTTEYEASSEGNKYKFKIIYKKREYQDLGIEFEFYENKMRGRYFVNIDSNPFFDLKKVEQNKQYDNISLSIQYFKINDPDGYSNLRDKPNGEIIRKVLEGEKFEILSTEGEYKKVKLYDATVGYIHSSRVVEY